jgi:ectoine hydroxylase-related dioxygenase (phytanoyl-CoA dioxygenase family)
MTPSLSREQVVCYERDGFVVLQDPLPAPLLGRVHAAVQRIAELNPGLELQTVMNVHLAQSIFGGRVLHGEPALVDIAADPAILDAVERVLGPDILLWGVALFCKPPGGREVPLHQDGAYWPIVPLAGCTAWLALDDSGPENGGMRFVPGSHRVGNLEHRDADEGRSFGRSVSADAAGAAREVSLTRGQMSLHHVSVVHGSYPNASSRRRAGIAFRFMPATSYLERASGVPVYLLRGEERTGKNEPCVIHGAAR